MSDTLDSRPAAATPPTAPGTGPSAPVDPDPPTAPVPVQRRTPPTPAPFATPPLPPGTVQRFCGHCGRPVGTPGCPGCPRPGVAAARGTGPAPAPLVVDPIPQAVAPPLPAVASSSGTAPAAADALAALQRMLPERIRTAPPAVTAGVVAVVGLVLFGLVVIGSTSSGGGSSWATVLTILVGLLAVAAAFTPTMPPVWRAGAATGGAVALVAATTVTWSDASVSGWGVLLPLVPALVVGAAGYGWWQNHQTGATATAPGWVGAGAPPPAAPNPVPFPLPPTAGARSRVCLEARVAVPPDVVMEAVTRVAAVRGNWFVVRGDHVRPVGTDAGRQVLAIGGSAVFRARSAHDGRGTVLRVGGLDQWVQSRSYYAGFIPVGFAHVQGYWAYKCYLQTLAAELARLDPMCRITIGAPSGESD